MTGEQTNQELLCHAIEEERVVTFNYNWRVREGEPYLVGTHKDEEELMVRVFQTGGESISGGLPDWRLFRLGRISNLELSDESFRPRRSQYEPNDPDLLEPVCKV